MDYKKNQKRNFEGVDDIDLNVPKKAIEAQKCALPAPFSGAMRQESSTTEEEE